MMMWRFLLSIILVSLEVVALTHSFSTPPLLSTSTSISISTHARTRTHTRTITAHSHTRIEKNWNGQHISQRIGRRGALFSTDTEIEIEIEQTEKQIEMDSNVNADGNPGADINIKQKQATSEKLLGILVLLTVPLSWGTYAPVVKYVYEMDPPVPGFVFSAGYYLIASVTLTLLAVGMSWKNEVEVEVEVGNISTTDVNDKGADADADADTNNIVGTMKTMQETEPSTSFLSLPLQTRAGIELGSYLFLGNCLQVVGLKTVPADRAAFLVQLTTVMVPLFSAIFAGDLGAIPAATWVACVLAFAGVLVMGLDRPDLDLASLFQGADVDGSGSGSGSGVEFQGVDLQGLAFSQGDVLITLAAVSYTMHVIRLGRYAKHTKPLNLAASKATVEAVLSIGLVAGLMTSGASTSGVDFVREMSGEIQSYFLQLQNAFDSTGSTFPPDGSSAALWACLWTGWVTCAYTIYAQSFGQSRVNPTDANLIYTMQPIFSSLFAYFLLGESLGVFGFGGASLIFFALWVVTSSNQSSDASEE